MSRPDPSPATDVPPAAQARFAEFVRTLGRGPGRSRALTREEAREALGMVLAGRADPHQVGAFLMLLRYRGEDPEEVTGLIEAARDAAGLGRRDGEPEVDLDWPSYGAGRTRGAPWFLLAALALASSGRRVLMHGSNEFSTGLAVADALPALGLAAAQGRAEAAAQVASSGFAYLPLAALCPRLDGLLRLRHLLGLRSPVNTVARLLDPLDARAAIDGVFHPPYIDLHLGVAERLDRPSLLTVKGAGGEAERGPLKPVTAHAWRRGAGRLEHPLPALASRAAGDALLPATLDGLAAVWRGGLEAPLAVATVTGTIALALVALGEAGPAEADEAAVAVWRERRDLSPGGGG